MNILNNVHPIASYLMDSIKHACLNDIMEGKHFNV